MTLVPGGYLSEKFGPKWVLFSSISGGILCTFLSPVVARSGGFAGFMALKIIQGLLQVIKFVIDRNFTGLYQTEAGKNDCPELDTYLARVPFIVWSIHTVWLMDIYPPFLTCG